MTQPNVVPAKWQNTYKDYLQTKVDRGGCSMAQTSVVSVASGTANGQIIGLMPFNRGFRPEVGSISIQTDALGAGATFSLGVIYADNVTYTNNQTLFGTGYAAATAGSVSPDNQATSVGRDYVAPADGWLVATMSGTVPAATGNITSQVPFVYDGLNTAN